MTGVRASYDMGPIWAPKNEWLVCVREYAKNRLV
jgi:hypothetical protein